MTEWDVIIVGAGPAGASAAQGLASTGARVLLLDRGDPGFARLPETFAGLAPATSSRLGLEGSLAAFLRPPAPVQLVLAHGELSLRLSVQHHGGQQTIPGLTIDRAAFDRELVARAARAGAEIQVRCAARDVQLTDGAVTGVLVELGSGEQVALRCRALVDATGKASFLPRKLGLRQESPPLDPRSTFFSHFVSAAFRALVPEGGMSIAPFEDGYLLLVDLGADRYSVFCAVSPAWCETHTGAAETRLEQALANWPALSNATRVAQRVLPVFSAINASVDSKRLAGPGFAIVGESAHFPDPFFSNGLGVALEVGCATADALSTSLSEGREWRVAAEHAEYEAKCRDLIAALSPQPEHLCEQLLPPQVCHALTDPHLPWLVSGFLTRFAAGTTSSLRSARDAARSSFGQRRTTP